MKATGTAEDNSEAWYKKEMLHWMPAWCDVTVDQDAEQQFWTKLKREFEVAKSDELYAKFAQTGKAEADKTHGILKNLINKSDDGDRKRLHKIIFPVLKKAVLSKECQGTDSQHHSMNNIKRLLAGKMLPATDVLSLLEDCAQVFVVCLMDKRPDRSGLKCQEQLAALLMVVAEQGVLARMHLPTDVKFSDDQLTLNQQVDELFELCSVPQPVL